LFTHYRNNLWYIIAKNYIFNWLLVRVGHHWKLIISPHRTCLSQDPVPNLRMILLHLLKHLLMDQSFLMTVFILPPYLKIQHQV
jgi:hypothetical protein